MSRRAFPRLAEFKYFRRQPNKAILILRITEGPASEKGKDVHVTFTKVDLPVLREIVRTVEGLEES